MTGEAADPAADPATALHYAERASRTPCCVPHHVLCVEMLPVCGTQEVVAVTRSARPNEGISCC